jgi:histone-lysine N-methyltransferase MLL3
MELEPQLQLQPQQLQSNVPKTIIRSSSTPTGLGDTKIIISQAPASVASSIPSSNIQTSQSNNVLYVKQFKPLSSSGATTPHTSTIVVVSQPGQVQSQGSSVITLNKQSNRLIDYLSSQQKLDATKMEPPSSVVEGMPKSVTILKSNPTITNLLNASANSFKRSKSSDDVVTATKEVSSDSAMISKRLSLEVSNEIKKEPLDSPVIKEAFVPQSIANTTTITTVIKTEPMNVSPIPQVIHKPHQKNEDSQNVLLKQLLQNSGSSNPVGQINRQPVFSTTQRAPSLGMFSSLEAQLARPIIPPTTAKIVTTQASLVPSIISQTPVTENLPKSSPSPNMNKVSLHETSFVSQPAPAATPPTSTIPQNIPISSPMSDKKPVVVLNRNDIPANILTQHQQPQSIVSLFNFYKN